MKRTAMGVVCLFLAFTVFAQVIPQTGNRPSSGTFGKDIRPELFKAKTIKATGIVLTLAGVASTAIGIDMEIRRTKHTISNKNKSVFILTDPTPIQPKSGKNYIITGAVATVIGIPTWYAGAKKIKEIRCFSGSGRDLFISLSPPVPVMTQGSRQAWLVQTSIRF